MWPSFFDRTHSWWHNMLLLCQSKCLFTACVQPAHSCARHVSFHADQINDCTCPALSKCLCFSFSTFTFYFSSFAWSMEFFYVFKLKWQKKRWQSRNFPLFRIVIGITIDPLIEWATGIKGLLLRIPVLKKNKRRFEKKNERETKISTN